MPVWVKRAAIWAPLLIAVVLVAAYAWMHRPFAVDGTELVNVPLSQDDPTLTRVGDLRYLGGLDIPRMDQNVGGLSGLRWDARSERLLAITDDARWVWMTPIEEDGLLIGIGGVEVGDLLGPQGEILSGKEDGDSESLVYDPDTGWAVSFERNHRILSYGEDLTGFPAQTLFDPEEQFGGLESNNGLEAIAVGDGSQLICAERMASPGQANCLLFNYAEETYTPFPVAPPQALIALGATPTDADALADGTFVVLLRSYSPQEGNHVAIVSVRPSGERRELATLSPPLTTDNFEGIAVREEAGRTFLYIVSDDNFSSSQRTLLMKFEWLGRAN